MARRPRGQRRGGESGSRDASRDLDQEHDGVYSRAVTLWTHEPPNFSKHNFVLNVAYALPHMSDAELLLVRGADATDEIDVRRALVFTPAQALEDVDVIARQQQLQLSIAKSIAGLYGFSNRTAVVLTRTSRQAHTIDHIELYFKDQYIGRSDMWRLSTSLLEQCVYVGQKIQLPAGMRATVRRIYIGGQRALSGYVAPSTKTVFRSESAKYDVLIQMSKEMWEFDEGGEIYYEKVLQGFLPDLLERWDEIGTNHVVSVVLFTRVHYAKEEREHLEGLPVQQTASGQLYVDYYKVVVDLESNTHWPSVMRVLKEEFFRFQHDILLQPRRAATGQVAPPAPADDAQIDTAAIGGRVLLGEVADAHEGNMLEAINLALNPFEEHYIDRDLARTGFALVMLTAGGGHFSVDQHLLRTTTQRVSDIGISLDLVCLAQMPLHTAPIFSFATHSDNALHGVTQTEYSVPYWINCSFYTPELDRPYRPDRFVPRCKMDGMRMIELVGSGQQHLAIPYLDMPADAHALPSAIARRAARERFDADLFRSVAPTLPVSPALPTTSALPVRIVPLGKGDTPRRTETSPAQETLPTDDRIGRLPDRLSYPERPAPAQERPGRSNVRRAMRSRSRAWASPRTPGSLSSSMTSSSFLDDPGKTVALVAETITDLVAMPSQSRDASPSPKPKARRSWWKRFGFGDTLSFKQGTTTPTSARRASALISAALAPPSPNKTEPVLLVHAASDTVQMMQSPPVLLPSEDRVPSNPLNPHMAGQRVPDPLFLRWHNIFLARGKHDFVKWWSMTSPACLPLNTPHLPSESELQTEWEEYPYTISVYSDTASFLLKRGTSTSPALALLREMCAQRLAQGFQFVERQVLQPGCAPNTQETKHYVLQHPTELLRPGNFATGDPIYLSTTNQIHCITYQRQAGMIHVTRYIKKTPYSTEPVAYRCCVWPRYLAGYHAQATRFVHPDPHTYNWTYLDSLIAGYEDTLIESLRYWRARFVLVPSAEPVPALAAATGEGLSDEEVRLLGTDRLAELFARAEYFDPNAAVSERAAALRFVPTSLDPSSSMLDQQFVRALHAVSGELRRRTAEPRRVHREAHTRPLAAVAADLAANAAELQVQDRLWHRVRYSDTFTGAGLVDYLCRTYDDVRTREDAVQLGRRLQDAEYIAHALHVHGFLDGHYFYRLTEREAVKPAPPADVPPSAALPMSRSFWIDLDPGKKSDRAEVAVLHHDLAHNAENGFNFQIHWLGTTARLIEDQVQAWTRAMERYGLRLVEAPIGQIKDVSAHNPFRAPLPIGLARAPPERAAYAHLIDGAREAHLLQESAELQDETEHWLYRHVVAGYTAQMDQLFEMALLNRFGFVLDQEAHSRYPAGVQLQYSSRPTHFTYTQFVHRSGVAFVQVRGGAAGFLWLHNRLFTSHMPVHKSGMQNKMLGPPPEADDLRKQFQKFCDDPVALETFYQSVWDILARMQGK